ncbi:MAG: Holliday junction DNA helicase RuvB C-terminal domain-containing protein [Planctomycetota bacterium]|jgi:Holliday junction DNA helicase RuvB
MKKNTIGTDINQIKLTSLSHIQGQPQVIDNLELHLRAYFNTRSAGENSDLFFGPVILCGPSGTGKTMVAKAIHAELGNLKLIETNGVTINKKSELFSIFINADTNTTIFIDEAQGMNSKAQYILLTAISERNLCVPAGISINCNHTIPLANFTLIMATTHEYLLQDALRNRMRVYCRFNYYSANDLVEIVRQRADTLKWQYESDEVLQIIAERAKGIPRLALNTNLQTCWHVTKSHNRNMITLEDVHEAFHHLQIDESGLEQQDRSYLKILLDSGPTSLGVLSSKLSLPTLTIQRIIESYLLKEDFITKGKSSVRIITEKGRNHIENTLLSSKQWRLNDKNIIR